MSVARTVGPGTPPFRWPTGVDRCRLGVARAKIQARPVASEATVHGGKRVPVLVARLVALIEDHSEELARVSP